MNLSYVCILTLDLHDIRVDFCLITYLLMLGVRIIEIDAL